jgi:DNA polymerase-3 subunit alpha (Gram-positive type)
MIGGKTHRLFSYRDSNEIMPNLHLRTADELSKELSFLNNNELVKEIVVDNSIMFSDLIENNIKPIADGLFAPHIEDEQNLLKKLVYTKMEKIYGATPNPIITERVEKELALIKLKDY